MILLSRAYAGYLAGTIVQLPASEEAALIAQGLATTSAGPVTPGNVTTTKSMGRCGIAAAGTSVTVTNPNITPESRFSAFLAGAAADATAFDVVRVNAVAGAVTFYLNAAATAAVAVDWMLLPSAQGMLPPN